MIAEHTLRFQREVPDLQLGKLYGATDFAFTVCDRRSHVGGVSGLWDTIERVDPQVARSSVEQNGISCGSGEPRNYVDISSGPTLPP